MLQTKMINLWTEVPLYPTGCCFAFLHTLKFHQSSCSQLLHVYSETVMEFFSGCSSCSQLPQVYNATVPFDVLDHRNGFKNLYGWNQKWIKSRMWAYGDDLLASLKSK